MLDDSVAAPFPPRLCKKLEECNCGGRWECGFWALFVGIGDGWACEWGKGGVLMMGWRGGKRGGVG